MDEEQLNQLLAFKLAARDQAALEILEQVVPFPADSLSVVEIDENAIAAYEAWHNDQYEFGWERILTWKSKPRNARAIDIAVWYEETLAGLCWASPQDSPDKIMVLYLQRNPDNDLATRGYIAPLCLSVVRNYALLLGLQWVVIKDPIPEARKAYLQDGFKQVKGIGLAYDLTRDYAALNGEVIEDDY